MTRRDFLQALPPALTQPREFKLPGFALVVSESRPLAAASQGARFANVARADQPWVALLTGRNGRDSPMRTITIAQALKSRNYRTGYFGAWRLGEGPGLGPRQRGFDVYSQNAEDAAAFLAGDPQRTFACVNGKSGVEPDTNRLVWRLAFSKPEFLVEWPGAVAVRVSKEPVALMDVFPTLMQLATAPSVPGEQDGESLWLLLTGERERLNRRFNASSP